MDLEQYRLKINEIDDQLLKLFNERMDIVGEIAQYKRQNKLPIFNQSREDSIIEEISKKANPDIVCETAELFKSLMDVSRWYQSRLMFPAKQLDFNIQISPSDIFAAQGQGKHVAFQGVPGSYSEEAAMACLPQAKLFCVENFEDVFEAVDNGQAHYGVLPIDNSSTGAIVDIYDLLKNKGFYIVGEKTMKVDHKLLGINGATLADITEVFSHPQGLKQCSEFIKKQKIKPIPVLNTAGAAKMVSESKDKTKAAIASKNAAALYGLDVLADHIQDSNNNFTRFIVIAKRLELSKDASKISVLFSVPHVSGALYRILAHFSYNRLNLLKIESRPILGSKWGYAFFLDFEGSLSNTDTAEVISRLANDTEGFTLLGNYPVLE